MPSLIRYMAATMVAAVIALSAFAAPSIAASVSQREYKRGYNDCMNGRYDQDRHGISYKKGCRAAENKLARNNRNRPAEEECPSWVSEAERYKYPACN